MRLYKFSNPAGKVALTKDPQGSNLPESLGPWTLVANRPSVDMQEDDTARIGGSAAEIIQTVNADGFYLTKDA